MVLTEDQLTTRERPDFSKNANKAETAPAYLSVWDIHAYYGESYIVQGISFNVHEGEILALLGRNGAGKTSTLRSIARVGDPVIGIGFYRAETPLDLVLTLGAGLDRFDRRTGVFSHLRAAAGGQTFAVRPDIDVPPGNLLRRRRAAVAVVAGAFRHRLGAERETDVVAVGIGIRVESGEVIEVIVSR